MLEKSVNIDGTEYTMRVSALIPKLYRAHFGRDMVKDMRSLTKAYQRLNDLPEEASEEEREEAQFEVLDLEIFSNIAWLMLKYGGNDVGSTPDEWLESIDGVFSIYAALPAILELWGANNKTTSVPRKK